jgi:hypothetical protein
MNTQFEVPGSAGESFEGRSWVRDMKRVATYLFLIFMPQVLPAATGYLVRNLVADDATTATADSYDPRLVNPWGLAVSGTEDGAGPLRLALCGCATPERASLRTTQ